MVSSDCQDRAYGREVLALALSVNKTPSGFLVRVVAEALTARLEGETCTRSIEGGGFNEAFFLSRAARFAEVRDRQIGSADLVYDRPTGEQCAESDDAAKRQLNCVARLTHLADRFQRSYKYS